MFEITGDQKKHILDEMNDRFKSAERIETGVDQVLSLWQEKDGSPEDL